MKKYLYLLLLLAILPTAWAVSFSPVRELLVTGKSCGDILPHAHSIMEWSLKKSPTVELTMPSCYCSDDDCRVDVLKISPYFVREYTTFSGSYTNASAFNGPNCFNAALVSSGTLTSPSFSHPRELTSILNSPLCTQRSLDETLQAGDIIVVRNQNNPNFEVHAGTYVSPNLAFSKYGMSNRMSYSYGTDVINAYGVNKEECRRVYGIPQENDPCYKKPFANFYHCMPLYSFISKLINAPGGINEKVRQIYAKVSSLDMSVSRVAYDGNPVTEAQLSNSQKEIKKQYRLANRLKNKNYLSSDEQHLAIMMKERTFSLYEQTRIIAHQKGFSKLTGAFAPQ